MAVPAQAEHPQQLPRLAPHAQLALVARPPAAALVAGVGGEEQQAGGGVNVKGLQAEAAEGRQWCAATGRAATGRLFGLPELQNTAMPRLQLTRPCLGRVLLAPAHLRVLRHVPLGQPMLLVPGVNQLAQVGPRVAAQRSPKLEHL